MLDASAAIETVLSRPKSADFRRQLEEADQVLAPELIVPEIVNTVWKYHQFENMSLSDCDHSIEFAIGLVDRLVPSIELRREAFMLARLSRRSAYDMLYLALARREDAAFLTADRSLRTEAAHQGIQTL